MPSLSLVRRSVPRAVLRVAAQGTGLTLHDAEGVQRAALGHATIEHRLTGRVEELSEGSATLFDRRGQVQWQAPPAAQQQ